ECNSSDDIGIALDVSGFLRNVGNVNMLSRGGNAADTAPWTGVNWAALLKLRESRRCTEQRSCQEGTLLNAVQNSKVGFADARRVLQHRLEHGLQLAGRTWVD